MGNQPVQATPTTIQCANAPGPLNQTWVQNRQYISSVIAGLWQHAT